MTKQTAASAIGELWLSICAHDGRAASVMHINPSAIKEEERLRLLIAFQRLRLGRCNADDLARLCPKALLEGELAVLPDDIPMPDLNAVRLGLA